jgi:serine/threonine protein kinase
LDDHPRYRILGTLGSGGTGIVFKAEHRPLERTVVLKIIHKSLTDRPKAIERFRQEAKAAARLNHPNIVEAFDAERAGDLHFLVMEYLGGRNLDELVRSKGPLPVALACEIVRQAALGLQHAHERGMVHRDLKPHNLLSTAAGQVKIVDFGFARFCSEYSGSSLTAPGVVLGTPDYFAPEQALDARRADIRADIYGLGCTLYFLLAGRPPFPEGSPLQKLMAHQERTPPSLADLRPMYLPNYFVSSIG